MSSIPNHLLIKAINHEPIDRTPIWVMRQAGRYLPEYIKLKNKAGGFINLIKNPELACEITMQPLNRFSLDSAIVFSDILVIADMIGINLSFVENKGPVFDKTITTQSDLESLQVLDDITKLNYVFQTIKLIKKELNNKKPLIGFIGSPWTVATYVIEGNSSKTFKNVLHLLKNDVSLMHNILDMLTNISIKYLNKQIESGIDVAMIFDTWGSLLSDNDYEIFSLNYIKKIKNSIINKDIPIIYYVRESGGKIDFLKKLNVDVIGIDSTTNIREFKNSIGNKFALQGNLDVDILKSDKKTIYNSVNNILKEYNNPSGHIFNLGTGITPDIHPDKVKYLIDVLADVSPQYNVK